MEMDFNHEKVNALAKALGGRIELLENLIKQSGLTPGMIQKIRDAGLAEEYGLEPEESSSDGD